MFHTKVIWTKLSLEKKKSAFTVLALQCVTLSLGWEETANRTRDNY